MKSSFRYVDQRSDNSVNLFLFSDSAGSACATVRGPVILHADEKVAPIAAHTALPLARGFALAIRMANRNDVEIVVSGDRALWDKDWGSLASSA